MSVSDTMCGDKLSQPKQRPEFPAELNDNKDPEFWWRLCEPELSGLLGQAGSYSVEEKQNHLLFFRDHCAPWIGPRPTGQLAKDSAAPVEMSINLSGRRSRGIVRFQMDPLAATTGKHVATDDPSGRKAVDALLDYFESLATGANFTWARQLADMFMPTNQEEVMRLRQAEKTSLPFPLSLYGRAPLFNFAFDLEGPKRKMKTYCIPGGKSLSTGRSAQDLCLEAIRSLQPGGSDLKPAVDCLEKYLATCPGPLSCDFIGIDAIDPSKARVKLYLASATMNNFDFIRHVWTLGGLACDETRLRGLEILRSIWHLIIDEEEGSLRDDSNKPPKASEFFLGCVYFSFEIAAGKTIPDVKLYVPLWQYAKNDRKIAENISAALRKLGHHESADEYMASVRTTFSKADFDNTVSVHTQVSYTYSEEKGAYLTTYYGVSGKCIDVGDWNT